MKVFIRGALFFIIFYSTYAYSDNLTDGSFEELQKIRSLKCTFTSGIQADWEGNNFHLSKGSYGSEPIFFDSINLASNTARMIGNIGTEDVKVVLTGEYITFVELSDSGNFIFTTVFPVKNTSGAFAAVTSRHINVLNNPIPSQYYGICENWG